MTMNSQDLDYLNQAIYAFKQCILRDVENTGCVNRIFQMTFSDIESKTGRDKVPPSLVEHYLKFLENEGMQAEFDVASRFIISVDLDHLLLQPDEALMLANGLSCYQFKQQ